MSDRMHLVVVCYDIPDSRPSPNMSTSTFGLAAVPRRSRSRIGKLCLQPLAFS